MDLIIKIVVIYTILLGIFVEGARLVFYDYYYSLERGLASALRKVIKHELPDKKWDSDNCTVWVMIQIVYGLLLFTVFLISSDVKWQVLSLLLLLITGIIDKGKVLFFIRSIIAITITIITSVMSII